MYKATLSNHVRFQVYLQIEHHQKYFQNFHAVLEIQYFGLVAQLDYMYGVQRLGSPRNWVVHNVYIKINLYMY